MKPYLRLSLLGLLLALAPTVGAYDLAGTAWPNGTIPMSVKLSAPSKVLSDGSASWDDVALAAMNVWNSELKRCQFAGTRDASAADGKKNGQSTIFFDSTYYGESFGDRTLAITFHWSYGLSITESDIIVNNAVNWNSYRGTLRSGVYDLQRVMVHELGHTLGLLHPDEAEPVQEVSAIMNSTVSNVDSLQADDLSAIATLYGQVLVAPASTTTFPHQTIDAGQPLDLNYVATGTDLTYLWAFTPVGGETRYLLNGDGIRWPDGHFRLFSTQASDAGEYDVLAMNYQGIGPVATANITVNPVSTATATLANLSARGRAGSGDDTFIVGFVVTGSTPKTVLVRGTGPALIKQGVSSALLDPKLKLYRYLNGTFVAVSENDDWASVEDPATVRTTAARLGAFALEDGSKDATLLVTLEPGLYTAHIEAKNSQSGIAMVEVYDADTSHAASLTHRLMNVSTRSYAGKDEEMLFGGFVVDGPGPKQVLIRAIGPGLKNQGVSNYNPDPNLVIYKAGVAVADNDDWAFSNQTDLLPSIFSKVGAFALEEGSFDCALLITLPPGAYSAQVSGRNGETGVVLLEVYEVPE